MSSNRSSRDSKLQDAWTRDNLKRIINLFEETLTGFSYKVFIFGSRAKGTAVDSSDIDLVIDAQDIKASHLSKIRFSWEESTMPVLLDLIDIKHAAVKLKKEIQDSAQLLWEL